MEELTRSIKKRYTNLAVKMLKKIEQSQEHHSDVARSIDQHIRNTAVSLDPMRRGGSSASKCSHKRSPTACTIDYCTLPEAGSAVTSLTRSNMETIQLKIHDSPNPSAESALMMAITDCIHSIGIPFSVASQP
jgi:hypothetical protein